MMAYMNEEAFDHTVKTGRMTYYSRSRKCIGKAGETSGILLRRSHYLSIVIKILYLQKSIVGAASPYRRQILLLYNDRRH